MKSSMKIINLTLLSLFASNLQAEVTYMAKVVSDFVFEGISQSNSKPALQGYIEYANDSGFYLHTWGSNVDFGETLNGAEIDIYLGYETELTENLTLDTGYVNYFYVADNNQLSDYEYAEIYANLTFQENTTIYLWLADDEALGGRSNRFKIAHTFPLSDDYKLKLTYHVWQTTEPIWDTNLNDENGNRSYNNFSIGLSKVFNGFELDLSYSDTNLKYWQEGDPQLTFSISRTFE